MGRPQGYAEDPVKNRLAGRVADLDLSHLDFVDSTPVEEAPGATEKSIWDARVYEAEEFGEDKVIVRLSGGRLDGALPSVRAGRTASSTGWSRRQAGNTGPPAASRSTRSREPCSGRG
jgi:hypothetical protein